MKYGLLACVGLYLLGVAVFLRRHWPGGEAALARADGQPEAEVQRAAILDKRIALGVVDAKPKKFVTFLVCKVRIQLLCRR